VKLKISFKTNGKHRWFFFVVIVVVLGFLLRVYNISDYRQIAEDEALHSYVAYELQKNHLKLYRDIWSPQSQTPISFVLQALSFYFFGYNGFAVRFVSVTLGTLTIPLIYFIGRKIYNREIGLFASIIYAVYLPYTVEIDRWGYDSSFITPFVVLGMYFLVSFLKDVDHKNQKLFLPGFFLGTAFMLKLYSLPVILVSFTLILMTNLKMKGLRKKTSSFLLSQTYFTLGLAVVPVATLVFLYSTGAWEPYISSVMTGRMITISVEAKVTRLIGYFNRTAFMLVLSVPAMIYGVASSDRRKLLLVLWYMVPLIILSLMPNLVDSIFHFTSPALAIMGAVTLVHLLNVAFGRNQPRNFRFQYLSNKRVRRFMAIVILILVIVVCSAWTNFGYWYHFSYSSKPSVEGQVQISDFITLNTNKSEKIFAVDASLAILSQRSIIKVGEVKIAGFYSDIFGYDYWTYVGIQGYPQGIITPEDVLQAIQSQRPKLIISAEGGTAFVPADYFIWNGDPKWLTPGIGPWVMKNYRFLREFDNAYGRYKIWIDQKPQILLFEDFEDSNSSSNGKTWTIQTLGEKTDYSFSQERNHPIYGNNSAKINYLFSGEEHEYVRLSMKSQQTLDLSSFNAISVWIRGDETQNGVWIGVVDTDGRERGVFTGILDISGLRNIIVPLSNFKEIDLSRISEIRVSIDNDSVPRASTGEIYVDEIIFLG